MLDFGRYRISWGGGHGLDRAYERAKPIEEIVRVIRTSTDQVQGEKPGRWSIFGCIEGERTQIVVRDTGKGTLIVVTVFGKEQPCT